MGVIKYGRLPAEIEVATVALLLSLDVDRRQAFGQSSIVATRTAAKHFGVVHRLGRHPVGCGVARLAIFGRKGMAQRAEGAGIHPSAVVTEAALSWGTFEDTADVTGFAGHLEVGIIKIETVQRMIISFRCSGGCCMTERDQAERDQTEKSEKHCRHAARRDHLKNHL